MSQTSKVSPPTYKAKREKLYSLRWALTSRGTGWELIEQSPQYPVVAKNIPSNLPRSFDLQLQIEINDLGNFNLWLRTVLLVAPRPGANELGKWRTLNEAILFSNMVDEGAVWANYEALTRKYVTYNDWIELLPNRRPEAEPAPMDLGEAIDQVIKSMGLGERLRLANFCKRVEEVRGREDDGAVYARLLPVDTRKRDPRIQVYDRLETRFVEKVKRDEVGTTDYRLEFSGYDNSDSSFKLPVRDPQGGNKTNELIAVTLGVSADRRIAGIDLHHDRIDLGFWNKDGDWEVVRSISTSG